MPSHQKPTSRKHTLKHPNKSLCTQAHLQISRTIPRYIIQKYQSSISRGINKFISNHKSKLQHLLDTAFNIQSTNSPNSTETETTHTTHFRVGCRHLNLADDPEAAAFKIPSFIDIFRHLITLPAITKQLTSEELAELTRILSLATKHDIYKSLHHSPVGNRLALVYTSVAPQIDLTSWFPTTDFHALLFNSFTSYTILEQIESQMNHVSICTLNYAGRDYPNFLYIFHHSRPGVSKTTRTGILDTLEINQIAENILRRVVFLGDVIDSPALPNRLIIFLTDAKKEIDDALEHQRHFRTVNVNTAVTNMHDIIIYRREEVYKSVFHELIHFHNLDFKRLPPEITQMALDYLQRTHNISPENEYLLYEAITESLANTLNAVYLSSTNSDKGSIKEFRNNLSREILFSTFQVAKILQTCGYNNWDEFILLDKKKDNSRKQWRQDSCVFSYYVLKLYILLNLDEYWTHLLDGKLKFQTSKNNISNLLDIFELGRNNPELKKIMNALLLADSNGKSRVSRMSSKKTKTQKNKMKKLMINKTLRMTCLDG